MSDAGYVLDASALLATIHDEPGADRIKALFGQAVIGAVNLSEVVAKLQERGFIDSAVDDDLGAMNLTVIPFDDTLAVAAGRLRRDTRHRGLSFGATVLTADRAWADLDLGVVVEVVR